MQCARHHQETVVSCGRCDAPICPRCMVYTDVGLRCRDCAPPQRGRPVWGPGVIGGLVLLALVLSGGLCAVGLTSTGGGGQSLSEFPKVADLEPKVTVEQVVDPWVPEGANRQPAAGHRFVAIEVTITGRSSGIGQIASPMGFKLTDSRKFAYSALPESSKDPALGQLQLAAGEKATGWVVFEIDAANEIRSLAYDSVPVDMP